MFGTFQKKISALARKSPAIKNALVVISHTPNHALHWYGILLLGLLVVVSTITFAGIMFHRVTNSSGTEQSESVQPATINRDNLRKALEIYSAREVSFSREQSVAPQVIDPGR